MTTEQSITFNLTTPPDDAFPLFTARREMEWDSEWHPTFIGSDAVFVVDNEIGQSIWVMTRFDVFARAIEYVRVTPEHSVGQIWIRVIPGADNDSTVTVTYRLIALTERGKDFVLRFAEEFPSKGSIWSDVINHYLATGKPLGVRYDVAAS